AESLVYIRSAKKKKDKGKEIVIEDESIKKKYKKQVQEEKLGYEEVVPMDSEEEVQRLKRTGQDAEAKPAKRQRTKEVSESVQEQIDELDDLIKLWSLVQERYNSSGLTKDKEIELWVELKMLFEPDAENFLELQKYIHDPLKWWLYDMCAVHHVSTKKGQDIFMLVKKDYLLTKGLATLMLSNKLRVDQQSEMAYELLTKIYNIANKTRK
ncbi:hypothetical protein Tco_1336823, partial [Tanacetum coccineum]